MTKYRIVENFRGRNIHEFCSFQSNPRKFSPQNLGMPYPPMIGFSIPQKFLHEMVTLTDPWKFSPSKVSCYTVVTFHLSTTIQTLLLNPNPSPSMPYRWKSLWGILIWRFGSLPSQLPIKIRNNILTYIHMYIRMVIHQTAKFRAANIFVIAIWGVNCQI